jgi:hypothetical protein
LSKFQSPRAITRPKIIEPERNWNLICNSSLYTNIPKIKSISQSIAKKVVTTKYLAKFQSPRAITRPKINGPERNVNLICNLSLYTHIPNIKSISQSIAKKSGDNYFISELRPLSGEDIKTQNKHFIKCSSFLDCLCLLLK